MKLNWAKSKYCRKEESSGVCSLIQMHVETKKVGHPEKYDPEGWALWFIDYIKAEGEGQKLLFTGNLMNGFLQVAQIH